MGMIKKIAKHGNSQAIVIDKAILDLLNIDDRTPLMVSTDGERLVITPVRDKAKHKKLLAEAIQDTNRRYGKMLKRLAQ